VLIVAIYVCTYKRLIFAQGHEIGSTVAQELKQESEGNNVDRVKVRERNGEDHSSKLGYPSKRAAMLPLRVPFSSQMIHDSGPQLGS